MLASILVLCAGRAMAEEGVIRREIDGGVHIPVLTKPPELKQFVEATYPPEAVQKGLTGSVKMAVTLSETGAVSEVTVTQSLGNGFDEAAVAAVKAFTFSAAEIDNVPAPVTIEYVYNFDLKPAQPDGGEFDADAGINTATLPVGELTDVPTAAGSNGTLKGTLLARGSRTRIANALVRCSNLNDVETVSDETGAFSLNVPAGPCDVAISAADYENYQTKEALQANETAEVNYLVRPKIVGYQTIVKSTREKKEVVRRTISRAELQKIPGTFGDPIRVIQNFPGVARAPFVSGQLIVRGANPNQTLTYFDGVQIPLLFHLAGGPSVVNAEFLERVDFYPGGFGARYGRAVGGVVDVASRKGAADTVHGVGNVNLLDASAFLEAPITDGVSVAVAARRSYIDVLLPLVLPKDPQGGALLILPAYWDYQVRLDAGPKRSDKNVNGRSYFSLFAFGSDDTLKVVATGGGRNRDITIDSRTTFHRIQGNWSYRKDKAQFKIAPYFGFDLATLDFGIAKFRADRFSWGVRGDVQYDPSEWFTFRVGTDIVNQTLVGEAQIPSISGVNYVSFPGAEPRAQTQRFEADVPSFDGALFAEADFRFARFTVTPGIRASHAYLNGQTRHAFDPRLWVRFEPRKGTTLKGSIGLYTQPPAPENMEPPPLGTPTLGYERAFQSSFGIAQQITEVINVDVTAFYNRRYENVVSPGPTTVAADGTVTTQRFSNDGLGRAYGLEVLARHEVTKNFFGWIAYTLNRSEERRAKTNNPYAITSFDQTHIVTAIASYRLPYGFEIGARFRYVTGQPKTPLNYQGDIYASDSNRFFGTFGAVRSARSKDFHQLDIRLDHNWAFDRWTLNTFIDVQNVYYRENTEATFFDYRFRQEFAVSGIPILPVIGMKGSF